MDGYLAQIPLFQTLPLTIFTVTPAEVLCGFSAVADQGTYYTSAVAATDTTAIRIPRAELYEELALTIASIRRIEHVRDTETLLVLS